jgi:hypothetical protein
MFYITPTLLSEEISRYSVPLQSLSISRHWRLVASHRIASQRHLSIAGTMCRGSPTFRSVAGIYRTEKHVFNATHRREGERTGLWSGVHPYPSLVTSNNSSAKLATNNGISSILKTPPCWESNGSRWTPMHSTAACHLSPRCPPDTCMASANALAPTLTADPAFRLLGASPSSSCRSRHI